MAAVPAQVAVEVLVHIPEEHVPALRRPPAGVTTFFAHVPSLPPLRIGELFFLEIGGRAVAQATADWLKPCSTCPDGWIVYWKPESICWLN